MRNIVIIVVMIFSFNTYSQSADTDCSSLNYGTFDILEKGVKVGVVYRKDNIQIEKYLNIDKLTYVLLRPNKCNFQFNAYYIKKKLDTISWDVRYSKIESDHYKYIAKPKYLKSEYIAEGEIKKISNSINKEYLKLFKEFFKM